MSRDNYMIPDSSDVTFDQAAAKVMRSCLRHYSDAPDDIRSILENIAIEQEQMMAATLETGKP